MDKFQFHVPITLNFKAHGRDDINLEVKEYLKQIRILMLLVSTVANGIYCISQSLIHKVKLLGNFL